MEERARKTHHCTAAQAATIAKLANVEKLIIGHFSTRYHNLSPLLEEAKTVFENTYLAIEGETFSISEELEPWTQLQQV
jgi:ribonuclease Z